MLGELNDMQIRNLLSSQVVGRLACTDGKQPYIVPVTYTYDGDYIYGQTNEGSKLKILRKNPNVCFEVDIMMDMRNWQSVIVYGKFKELKEDESDKARTILYNKVYTLSTSRTLHKFGQPENKNMENNSGIKQVMYRIEILKSTGRFEKG